MVTNRGSLTPMQAQVLVLSAAGLEQRAIADKLGLSLAAVKCQVKVAKIRLEAKNLAHAVVVAHDLGLLDLGEATAARENLAWAVALEGRGVIFPEARGKFRGTIG